MRIAKELRPDLKLEGPLQYDAAMDPVIAKQKVKGHSEVAGRATVLIFPSLEAGNNTYKVRTSESLCAALLLGACVIVAEWGQKVAQGLIDHITAI